MGNKTLGAGLGKHCRIRKWVNGDGQNSIHDATAALHELQQHPKHGSTHNYVRVVRVRVSVPVSVAATQTADRRPAHFSLPTVNLSLSRMTNQSTTRATIEVIRYTFFWRKRFLNNGAP